MNTAIIVAAGKLFVLDAHLYLREKLPELFGECSMFTLNLFDIETEVVGGAAIFVRCQIDFVRLFESDHDLDRKHEDTLNQRSKQRA